jgi:hypothetical protein
LRENASVDEAERPVGMSFDHKRVIGFFNSYRQLYPVSRHVLHGAAEQFQTWVKEQADGWGAPIVEAPNGRRDEFVEPYFKSAKPDRVVVILSGRRGAMPGGAYYQTFTFPSLTGRPQRVKVK